MSEELIPSLDSDDSTTISTQNQQNVKRRLSPKQRAFLALFPSCGTILECAQAVGIDRQTHNAWLRENATYREAFAIAKEDHADYLVKEATFRATKGQRRYKFHNGQPILARCADDCDERMYQDPETGFWYRHYYEEERSDVLLIFLTKAGRPEVYRERHSFEHTGKNGGPIKTTGTMSVIDLSKLSVETRLKMLEEMGMSVEDEETTE